MPATTRSAIGLGLPDGQESSTGPLAGLDWSALARRLSLSDREVEIIQGIMREQKDSVIAASLGILPHTVRTYLERLSRKLGVHSKVGVVVAVFNESLTMRQL